MKRFMFSLGLSLLATACGSTVSGTATLGEEVDIAASQVKIGTEGSLDAPARTVAVNAFKIDKFEVTNAQYRTCVKSGKCTELSQEGFDTIPDYYTNTAYDEYPVAFATFEQAQAYCTAQDKRLPTEAEWEAAARGSDGRTYPWGEAAPDCTMAHYGDCANVNGISGPNPVGTAEAGASASGAMDMAGNMAEWVADWYDSRAYYNYEDGQVPTSPEGGRFKSVRGGSWWCATDRLVAGRREPMAPFFAAGNIGFRCAK